MYIILLIYLLPSLYGIYSMRKDKYLAQQENRRTPELDLFLIAIAFGALGVWIGMYLFKHKTQKWYFIIGIPLLCVQQIAFTYLLLSFFK